ncbi:prolipoprotein diacylglyceryl transferase [Vaginella massiliensis]|uniref:prolipoprotein diacylglyceryl transferase n=1 Tax=Vaginella massiliensis TaxID=1816680 RepID=UPI0008390C92|nr:prolipoprotein diacylglyceryl transferase [Vaginella massiliensis]
MINTIFNFITWDPNPILFELGFIKIHIYSLCWIIAFVVGWYLMSTIYKRENENNNQLDPLFLYVFVGCILGARLGEFLFYDPKAFVERPLEVLLPIAKSPGSTFLGLDGYEFVGFQGLASHGAALGIIIAMYFFSRKYLKRSILWILDRIAVVVPLGGAAVRVGNFYNSEIVGKASDLPWAVKFVQQSASYGNIVPRHPAQLYEAIGYVILAIVMWILYSKEENRKRLGNLLGVFLFCLFFIRFVVEFFKEDQGKEAVAEALNVGLNNGQLLSIPFMLIGVYLYISSKQRIFVKA